MAQTTNSVIQYVSQPTSMNVDQTKVFNYLSSLPYNDTLYFLSLDSILEINGVISLNLPSGTVNFTVNDIQFESDTSYSLTASATQGNLSLFEVNNVRGGLIDLGNIVYALYPFGQGMHVLMKYNKALIPYTKCANDTMETRNGQPACGSDCTETYVDVLAMVTPEANAWLWNNWGVYSQWYLYQETHNFNLATFNSGIGNKRIRVSVVNFIPDFSYNDNHYISYDMFSLEQSQKAKSLKSLYNSDIMVLLTNRNYLGYVDGKLYNIAGAANTLDYTEKDKFCIVETPLIDPIRYTFAHEVAHQFGCDHDLLNVVDCPHGKSLDLGNGEKRKTIMALSPDYQRIANFSNPSVSFAGVSTGEVAVRDNAHQIDGIAFCTVAENEDLDQFTASIYNDLVCEGEPLDIWVDLKKGNLSPPPGFPGAFYGLPPYQYEWTWSLHASFTPSIYLGNDETIYLSEPPYCSPFYVMCKVTSSDGYIVKQRKRLTCDPNCPREAKNTNFKNSSLGTIIFPNPNSGILNINSVSETKIYKVELYDLNNLLLKSYNFSKSKLTIELNLNDLSNGMYLVKIYTAKEISIQKLIINKI